MFPCISVLLWTPLPSFCLRASSDSRKSTAPGPPMHPVTQLLITQWTCPSLESYWPPTTWIYWNQPSRSHCDAICRWICREQQTNVLCTQLCSPRRSIASLDHHQDTSPEVKLQRISRQQRPGLAARGAGPGCHQPPLAPCHPWDLLSSTSIPCSLTLQALELFLFVKKCQVTPCLHFLSFAVFSLPESLSHEVHTLSPSAVKQQLQSQLSRLSLAPCPGLLDFSFLSALLETAQEASISFNWPCFMKTSCWCQPWSYVTEMALGMCQRTPTFGMTPKPRVFCVQNSRNNVALEEQNSLQ